MRNVPQTAKDLSAYRFERAKEDLESLPKLFIKIVSSAVYDFQKK